jgi:hypothetical protein
MPCTGGSRLFRKPDRGKRRNVRRGGASGGPVSGPSFASTGVRFAGKGGSDRIGRAGLGRSFSSASDMSSAWVPNIALDEPNLPTTCHVRWRAAHLGAISRSVTSQTRYASHDARGFARMSEPRQLAFLSRRSRRMHRWATTGRCGKPIRSQHARPRRCCRTLLVLLSTFGIGRRHTQLNIHRHDF